MTLLMMNSISDDLARDLGKQLHLEMYCTSWDVANLHCLQMARFGVNLETLHIGENRFSTNENIGIHPPVSTLELMYNGCPNLKTIRLERIKKAIEYSRDEKEKKFVCTYQAVIF
jgi:hypothetical protein